MSDLESNKEISDLESREITDLESSQREMFNLESTDYDESSNSESEKEMSDDEDSSGDEAKDPAGLQMMLPRRSSMLNTISQSIHQNLIKTGRCFISKREAKEILGEERFNMTVEAYKNCPEISEDNAYALYDYCGKMFIVLETGSLPESDLVPKEISSKLRDCAGFIRNQISHLLCWAFGICDTISCSRVVHGLDKEFVPLCPLYLCQNVSQKQYNRDLAETDEHRCYPFSIEGGFMYVKKFGIPRAEPDMDMKDFDCMRPLLNSRTMYHISNVYKYPTLHDALQRLKTGHPVCAGLICFEGWEEPGIYRGPLTRGEYYTEHTVVMLDCKKIEGETVAVCKSSNGLTTGNDGFIFVSLEIQIIDVSAARKKDSDHIGWIKPQYLLSEFFSVDMECSKPQTQENHKFKVSDDNYSGMVPPKSQTLAKRRGASVLSYGHDGKHPGCDEQRSAVSEYFRVYKGNENNAKNVDLMGHSLQPFLARSCVDFLKNFFEDELHATQSIFSSKEKYEKILGMITDEDIQSELRGEWENSARSSPSEEATSLTRWEQLKTLQSKNNKALSLRTCVEEIVFNFTYPRIDLEVSKKMNHLLKAPFCVHPKTGRVCVPIDPNNCDEFDPLLAVPTLSQIIEEINSGGHVDDDNSDSSLLGKSINFSRSSFLKRLLKSCKLLEE